MLNISAKLIIYCKILQRFYDQWAARPARPPTLIERISPDSDNDEIARQLQICVAKLYQLAEYLQQQSIVRNSSKRVLLHINLLNCNNVLYGYGALFSIDWNNKI